MDFKKELQDKYHVYTFSGVWEQTLELAKKISKEFKADLIIAISRGGLLLARLFSDFLKINDLQVLGVGFYTAIDKTEKEPKLLQDISLNLTKRNILLIDDVADSGTSLEFAVKHLEKRGAKNIKTVTLNYKAKSKFKPDYYISEINKWIVYPWEYNEFIRLYTKQKQSEGVDNSQINLELRILNLPNEILLF